MDLYKLHRNEDKTWRSWIRAKGKNLEKVFQQAIMTLKKNENKNLQEIANELGVSYKMLQDWRKGRRAIPLWILKIIEEKTTFNFKDEVDFLKVYGSLEIKKPVLSDEYIEVIGRHCGDGSCSLHNNTYRVNIKEDYSLLRQHQKDLKKVLGIKVDIKKEQGSYLINVDSKIYYRTITEIFGIPSGDKKTYFVEEPMIISNLALNKRKYWLRGLIDTDGWIYCNKKHKSYTLGFKVVNKKLADDVYDLFKSLKIHVNKKMKGNYSQIEVTRKNEIKKYLQVVGSNNNRILSKFSL